MDINDKNYGTLARVLEKAYSRAADGKGKERHGKGRPFHLQPILTIPQLLGNAEGLAFQICKKVEELRALPTKEQRINELLDVIVYAAAMVLHEDIDVVNTTSITIDTSGMDLDKLYKLEQQLEQHGMLELGEASRRFAERATVDGGKVETRFPDAKIAMMAVDEPRVRQVIRDNAPPNKFSANPLKTIDVRGNVRGIVQAQWLPGVEGGDDYIEVAINAAAFNRSEISPERLVNAVTDILNDLAKVHPATPIALNLAPPGLQNYRGTIVGELLNSEGVTVKDGTGDWDRITVVFNPPVTE